MVVKVGTVTNKVLTTNVATLTTAAPHGLLVGDIVDVTAVDAVFNGRYTLTAVAAYTISYAKINANVATVAATGTITQVDPSWPELETDFPTLSEDEREHDGLWVQAVGGLIGT
jgi:hypothetical protein